MIGRPARLRLRLGAMRPDGPVIGRAGHRALAFADRILARMRRSSSRPRRLDRVLLGLGRPSVAMRSPVNMRFSPIVQLHLHAAEAAADAGAPRAAPSASPRRDLVRLRSPGAPTPAAAASPPLTTAATTAPRMSRTLLAPPAPVRLQPQDPAPPRPPPMERVFARATPISGDAGEKAPAPVSPTTTTILPPVRVQATAPSSGQAEVTLSRTEVVRVAEDVMGLLERRFVAARERFGGR